MNREILETLNEAGILRCNGLYPIETILIAYSRIDNFLGIRPHQVDTSWSIRHEIKMTLGFRGNLTIARAKEFIELKRNEEVIV